MSCQHTPRAVSSIRTACRLSAAAMLWPPAEVGTVLRAGGLCRLLSCRDVKPLNVIASERDARLKLIDLGAAADLRTGTNYSPEESILDPMYCPPEQVRLSEGVTVWSALPASAVDLMLLPWKRLCRSAPAEFAAVLLGTVQHSADPLRRVTLSVVCCSLCCRQTPLTWLSQPLPWH